MKKNKNMKANCLFLTFIITACVLFSACKSNENNNTFSAVIASYNGEKDYMSGRDIFWSEGDMVKINNGSYAIALDESDRNRATIYAEGVTAYNGSYYAAYPAGMAEIAIDGTMTFNIPAKQAYSKDGSGRQVARNIMAAKTDGSQFEFSPLGAMLHFSVSSSSADARLCAIEVTADKPVCGAMTATVSGSVWTVTPPAAGDNLKRALVFTTPESINAVAKDFYLAVMPFDNASSFTLRLVFETASGVVKVYDKTKSGGSISLEKGRMYLFNTSFDGTDVTVADATIHANTMDGTASHPYDVYSQRSWEYAMSSYAGTGSNHIELGGDIEVSASTNVFKASLDGKGHTITLTTDNISLFKQINNGTVQNLTIDAENAFTLPSPIAGDTPFGVLACQVTGTSNVVSNCKNKVDVTYYVNDRTGCHIGGLLGSVTYVSISNCINEGNVISDATSIGGIAGKLSNMISFTNNTNSGQIIFRTSSSITRAVTIGGLVGNLSGNIIVSNCTNNGDVLLDGTTTGTINCGGISGQSNSNYSNCGNYGTIHCNNSTNTKYVGGLIGYHNSGANGRNMVNCFNEGDIEADDVSNMFAGGLVCDDQYLNIKNSYAFCNLKGNKVAGLVYGRNQFYDAQLQNCYYYGAIWIDASEKYGLVGHPTDSYKYTITHCFYKDGYTMRYGSNGSDSGNCTISTADPLTLTNDDGLQATLNTGTAGIDGARGWTISGGHVVLAAE